MKKQNPKNLDNQWFLNQLFPETSIESTELINKIEEARTLHLKFYREPEVLTQFENEPFSSFVENRGNFYLKMIKSAATKPAVRYKLSASGAKRSRRGQVEPAKSDATPEAAYVNGEAAGGEAEELRRALAAKDEAIGHKDQELARLKLLVKSWSERYEEARSSLQQLRQQDTCKERLSQNLKQLNTLLDRKVQIQVSEIAMLKDRVRHLEALKGISDRKGDRAAVDNNSSSGLESVNEVLSAD